MAFSRHAEEGGGALVGFAHPRRVSALTKEEEWQGRVHITGGILCDSSPLSSM